MRPVKLQQATLIDMHAHEGQLHINMEAKVVSSYTFLYGVRSNGSIGTALHDSISPALSRLPALVVSLSSAQAGFGVPCADRSAPMATSATAFQCPMGTLPPSARKPQVRHTQARVHDVLSRARPISVSSSVCIERSRACAPAWHLTFWRSAESCTQSN